MHSCGKIHNKLVDLVFNEIGEEERFSLLQELNGCRECRELYKDMTGTLTLFDRLTDEALPEESYWAEYEDRLWSGLRDEVRPSGWRQRISSWIDYNPASRWLLPATAAVLVIIIGGLWMMLSRPEINNAVTSVEVSPTDVAQKGSGQKQVEQTQTNNSDKEINQPKSEPASSVKKYPKSQKHGLELVSLPRTKREQKPGLPGTIVDLSARLSEHLETSMLLLRSVRNARPAQGKDSADMTFEKGLARRLLGRNAALRREVESLGDMRSGELLAGLEPFLLDIANISDSASPEEIGIIRDVLEEYGLIAELQIYSAMALSPGL